MSFSRQDAADAFAVVDTDHDGMIDPQELTRLWERTGGALTPDRLAEIFAQADTNGDGLISLEEFVELLWPGAAESEPAAP
ncbi:EF-hand domain-containing protein [Actinomadura craniellae]|uniref:EF-hand domain-containing protein n=2 Tax=Actinomadura craniellae TaxID=2231787 RepID=A0A365H140_9ACTN|nr:EF-hand domain-containing protein [Actinomadura craniellae]